MQRRDMATVSLFREAGAPESAEARGGHCGNSNQAIQGSDARNHCCARHRPFSEARGCARTGGVGDRKSTRLNSSHSQISYAVFCLKKKTKKITFDYLRGA